jgi:hypothetical protein
MSVSELEQAELVHSERRMASLKGKQESQKKNKRLRSRHLFFLRH